MSLEEKYEREYCKGCKWYNYPTCRGTVIDGIETPIDKLRKGFQCGVKDLDEPLIRTTTPQKSELEQRVDVLEVSITTINERLSKVEEVLKISKV